MYKLFTSESVSEGHPDKIADQISDAILDEIIKKDKFAHVACEVFISKNLVLIGGEIKSEAKINAERIARKTVQEIGYNSEKIGFNHASCSILNFMGEQSEDIYNSIHKDKKQNAGDQGSVFGFATNETKNYMPAPIQYSHLLMMKHSELKKKHPFLYPDAKSQVTFLYENGKPIYIKSIVISSHHSSEIEKKELFEFMMDELIKTTIPSKLLKKNTEIFINPSGRFIIGGPMGDCGLTGRKIIVDTYGGFAKHGGGAFSGKDPSKIDRSAAYISRYIAKNIVASNLAEKCELQLSYVIGYANPISISINTFKTNKICESEIINIIKNKFDLSPEGIIKKLDLLRPIYKKTASYGHFGRNEKDFTWETVDRNIFDV